MEIRVYDDDEEWFRSIFANSKKEEAIQNQYEFFVQRMGGPPLYSQRKGKKFLISASSLIVFQMLIVDQCVSFPYGPAAADFSAVCLLPTGV